jgi:DNA-binding response OmpR family regulator
VGACGPPPSPRVKLFHAPSKKKMAIREILLVDRKTPITSAVGFALQCRGYMIMLAPDAATAFEDIQNYDFDLILVGLNGYEAEKIDFLRQAKKTSPESKIMVLGNPQTMVFPIETFRIEVDDYLVTPFTAPELCLRVEKCLRNGEAEDDKANPGEQPEKINQRVLDSLKFKIRNMHNTIYSLVAHINVLIEKNNYLLSDYNVRKINDISDDLITMMNITEDFLGNLFISGVECEIDQ